MNDRKLTRAQMEEMTPSELAAALDKLKRENNQLLKPERALDLTQPMGQALGGEFGRQYEENLRTLMGKQPEPDERVRTPEMNGAIGKHFGFTVYERPPTPWWTRAWWWVEARWWSITYPIRELWERWRGEPAIPSEDYAPRPPTLTWPGADGERVRYVEQLPDGYIPGTLVQEDGGRDQYTLQAPLRNIDPGAQQAAHELALRTRRPVLTVDGWVVPEELGANARLFHDGDKQALPGETPIPRMVEADVMPASPVMLAAALQADLAAAAKAQAVPMTATEVVARRKRARKPRSKRG